MSSHIPDRGASSPDGEHRVLDDAPGIGPKAAYRLDATADIYDTELRIDVRVLNLDSASYNQLREKHQGDGEKIRAEVLAIVAERGKMQNPVTGSGGMLIGDIAEIGQRSRFAHRNGFTVGDSIATLVSLTLTPLRLTDGLKRWDGLSEQVPAAGTAILFSNTIAAKLPADLSELEALAVFDVCGAPKLVERRVKTNNANTVAVLGAAGKSGALSVAAAR